KKLKLIAIAVFLLLPSLMSAQGRTDFAGRWTSDPDPAAAGPAGGRGGPARGDMGSGWGAPITVAQTAAQLTGEYAVFARGDMQPPLKFTYALDGSETKNSVMMGRGQQFQVSKTAWDGAKLVITTLHTFAGPDGKPMTQEVKQTLTLESPTSLVVEAVRAGVMGGPATTTRTVYRKLP